jgi:hypothetical protein
LITVKQHNDGQRRVTIFEDCYRHFLQDLLTTINFFSSPLTFLDSANIFLKYPNGRTSTLDRAHNHPVKRWFTRALLFTAFSGKLDPERERWA